MVETSAGRIERLRERMADKGWEVVFVSRPQNLFYLTGVRLAGSAPAVMGVTAERVALAAPAELPGWEVFTYPTYDIHLGWDVREGSQRALGGLIRFLGGAGTAGVESDALPGPLWKVLSDNYCGVQEAGELLRRLRKRRDADEVARIRGNVALNDRIFAEFAGLLQPGVPDWELWGVVQQRLNEAAGEPVLLTADLGAGLGGVRGDAKPSGYRLQEGDSVFLDIYSARDGYYADTTRSFTVGEPSAEQRKIHALLAEAQRRGEELLRPGVAANLVDEAVRGTIENAGYGAYFAHHSGHAFNVFQQDRPYFIPAETEVLEAGMTVTLEPGIYIPGWGGMRIERNYLIGETGPEVLDGYPIGLNGEPEQGSAV